MHLSFTQTQAYNGAIATSAQLADHGYWALDLETTGVGSKDEPLEVGIVDHTMQTVFHSYVMPTVPISHQATAKNGLSMDVLKQKGAPLWEDVQPQLVELFSNPPATVVIHNKNFDLRILEQVGFTLPDHVSVVCSLELSRILQPDEVALNGSHTAVGDCEEVVKRVRQFASTPMLDYPEMQMDEAADAIALLRRLGDQRKEIVRQEMLLKEKLARLLVDQGVNAVAGTNHQVVLDTSWTQVKIADGYSIQDVIEVYPDICIIEPALKSSVARSLPKIIRENGGELPKCLSATSTPIVKLKKIK
ncbi:MAG: 3'-5' exonuclease [Cyanobacteria bacterium P01_F01_bin.13]